VVFLNSIFADGKNADTKPVKVLVRVDRIAYLFSSFGIAFLRRRDGESTTELLAERRRDWAVMLPGGFRRYVRPRGGA
jgi:hypothetical protein